MPPVFRARFAASSAPEQCCTESVTNHTGQCRPHSQRKKRAPEKRLPFLSEILAAPQQAALVSHGRQASAPRPHGEGRGKTRSPPPRLPVVDHWFQTGLTPPAAFRRPIFALHFFRRLNFLSIISEIIGDHLPGQSNNGEASLHLAAIFCRQ